MKLKYFLFILAHYSVIFNCVAMEPKDLNPVKTAVNKAFENFGLCGNLFSAYEDNHELTPHETIWRWHRDSHTIHFTRDICSNPDLLEFAAHCVAADVKNSGYLKSQLARWASGAVGIAAPVVAASILSNESVKCLAVAATALPGLALVTDIGNLGTKFFQAVDNKLAKTALTLACEKLIEKKNYKTLATYCAYAKKIQHMPIGQEKQLEIIRKALAQDAKLLVDFQIHEKCEVQILDTSTLDAQSRNKLCATAIYP